MSSDPKLDSSTEKEDEGGVVLVCGATDFWAIGRTKDVRADVYPNLQSPHRLKALEVCCVCAVVWSLDRGSGGRSRSCRRSAPGSCVLLKCR